MPLRIVNSSSLKHQVFVNTNTYSFSIMSLNVFNVVVDQLNSGKNSGYVSSAYLPKLVFKSKI